MTAQRTGAHLEEIRRRRGTGFVLLLDPDDIPAEAIPERVAMAVAAGVDAFFVGGSFLMDGNFDAAVAQIKQAAGDHPVILFPGSIQQVSRHADAILFLSLISGRNAEHLIGNQVLAAPLIHRMGLEPISCGYMLIESGALTSAAYRSNSLPIPRNKPAIAVAHALAAQYMGMKCVYLEAGSGAQESVPEAMIGAVRQTIDIPVIVGGGIRNPETAHAKARAGADFVVIGTFFEEADAHRHLQAFAEAIHHA